MIRCSDCGATHVDPPCERRDYVACGDGLPAERVGWQEAERFAAGWHRGGGRVLVWDLERREWLLGAAPC